MISKWRFALRRFLEKIWVIAALYTLLGVLTPLLATLLGPVLPESWSREFGADAAATVLNILATSLLAVVTFSVGIMVQALFRATSAVTPRAAALLRADGTSQRTLSVFLGSFLYSLISIIALKSKAFTEAEALVLFGMTVLVVVLVAVTILRWIAHLTVFGLMSDSIEKVEDATRKALMLRGEAPFLGASAMVGLVPPDAVAVKADAIGYVQNVDVELLQDWAKVARARVYLTATPGSFVHLSEPLVHVQGAAADEKALRAAFVIAPSRTFDQDPRFGLAVMAEIAERALSPGINDPGTAIDILGRAVRVLAVWDKEQATDAACPLVFVPALEAQELIEDVFEPIARDGAGNFAVQIRLQKSLLALAQMRPAVFARAARVQSQHAMARCCDVLQPYEVDRLQDVEQSIARLAV